MKLQFKLALYNVLTKVAIVAILSGFILVFMNKISVSHIQQRLVDKRNKLISNISDMEINSLLSQDKSFTDYNILKEEYIVLTQLRTQSPEKKKGFTQESREIEGFQSEYQILTEYFTFKDKSYRLEIGETMLAVTQLESTVLFYAILILCITVGLTLLTDLAFSSFLLAPLYQIIDQKINKVNDPIHYNYEHIKTSTKDFNILDSSINSLMKKLSDLFISEKQFIANVSHEFLTPISVLSTRLENLLTDEKLSVNGETKIFASLKTLNRLKAIINSLLLISRVENNQFDKQDAISVKDVLKEVYDELEDRLLMKNLKLKINIEEDYTFKGNRSLFQTLLINFINNAIKYNVDNGSISVSGSYKNGIFNVTISDTGVGMIPEQVENAFSRFEKLKSDKSDSYGLGLAIARSIAVFHNIDIRISSAKNVGTDVYIFFKSQK